MTLRLSNSPGCVLDRSLVVTTSGRPTPELVRQAQAWAERLGVPYVPRETGLARLVDAQGVDGALVITPERPVYQEPASGVRYFFHPGMVKARLHNCTRGHDDPMLQAMALEPGQSVLDCTLGRASDAILAAWRVGPEGRVVGLEKSRLLAELTTDGLAHYEEPSPRLTQLLRRIEAHCADHQLVLPTLDSDSFDVVYFDPIFDRPLLASAAMAPLRALADPGVLTPEAIREGRRVARRRVVVKQRKGSELWSDLQPDEIVSGGAAKIEYGVFLKSGGGQGTAQNG